MNYEEIPTTEGGLEAFILQVENRMNALKQYINEHARLKKRLQAARDRLEKYQRRDAADEQGVV